jgi:hypothetical protein
LFFFENCENLAGNNFFFLDFVTRTVMDHLVQEMLQNNPGHWAKYSGTVVGRAGQRNILNHAIKNDWPNEKNNQWKP